MGAIRPELKKRRDNTDFLEGGKRHARRDNTDFAEYAEGGSVNEAGNYTKPGMRKALFNKIKAQATHGTGANEWSARKAQLLAKQYKAKGGSYKD
jgi:hypothetical protein